MVVSLTSCWNIAVFSVFFGELQFRMRCALYAFNTARSSFSTTFVRGFVVICVADSVRAWKIYLEFAEK